jgi:hypothetical protein
MGAAGRKMRAFHCTVFAFAVVFLSLVHGYDETAFRVTKTGLCAVAQIRTEARPSRREKTRQV